MCVLFHERGVVLAQYNLLNKWLLIDCPKEIEKTCRVNSVCTCLGTVCSKRVCVHCRGYHSTTHTHRIPQRPCSRGSPATHHWTHGAGTQVEQTETKGQSAGGILNWNAWKSSQVGFLWQSKLYQDLVFIKDEWTCFKLPADCLFALPILLSSQTTDDHVEMNMKMWYTRCMLLSCLSVVHTP